MKRISIVLLSLVMLAASTVGVEAENNDLRQYAHGVSYVKNPKSGKDFIVWSDAYKEGVKSDGSWTHDIYGIKINSKSPKIRAVRRLVKADEAQEPASASCTDDGNMIVTFEDGNDTDDFELAQRYVIYDSKMRKVKKYPQTIAMGGHSGHAASTKDRHIVFWSEGWVDGGGIDNLGSGDDVYVSSMDSDGNNMKTIEVCKSEKTRDWWPLIAASDSKALLVWQRYVDDEDYSEIKYAVYDPESCEVRSFSENSMIKEMADIKAKYYCYNVVYLPDIELFALNISCADKGGVILLIDEEGNIVKRIDGCKSFVREAVPAVVEDDKERLYYPVENDWIESIEFGSDLNVTHRTYSADFEWSYCGTAGFSDKSGNIWFAALDTERFKKRKKNLKLIKLNIKK